jgi:hypothetical protein
MGCYLVLRHLASLPREPVAGTLAGVESLSKVAAETISGKDDWLAGISADACLTAVENWLSPTRGDAMGGAILASARIELSLIETDSTSSALKRACAVGPDSIDRNWPNVGVVGAWAVLWPLFEFV